MNQNKDYSFFMYKGYPLVRNKNEIYYGSMADDFVIWMKILETKKVHNMDVASKIKIYKMSTDESLNPLERITNSGERESLYDALDLATAWLKSPVPNQKVK